MKTLVVGASGATGKELVQQLLLMEQQVKVIIRPTSNIPEEWQQNEKVEIIKGSVSEMEVDEMAGHLYDCNAAASCLGHNMTFKGMYGKPRQLVTDVVQLIHKAFKTHPEKKDFKFVLMNTAGNSNRDLKETMPLLQTILTGLLRLLLPPHRDNELASDYLRNISKLNEKELGWVVVRPDTLINKSEVTEYNTHISPIRSALLNPGKTSRINVGHFMANLITDDDLWNKWKSKMPVIYNVENNKSHLF